MNSGCITVSNELDAGPNNMVEAQDLFAPLVCSLGSWAFIGRKADPPPKWYPQISLKDSSIAVNMSFILFLAKDRNGQCSEPKADKSLHNISLFSCGNNVRPAGFPH